MFCEKSVLEKFTRFTGKHLCRREAATLLKRDFDTGVFQLILRRFYELFFKGHLQWLLLQWQILKCMPFQGVTHKFWEDNVLRNLGKIM